MKRLCHNTLATVSQTCRHKDWKSTTYALSILFLFASALIIGGCNGNAADSEDGFEEGIRTRVNISLTAIQNSPSGNRADGEPKDPETDNEKINDWFIVFVNKDNIVSKILTRSEATTSNNNPVEQETFSCTLPSGTYTVYAFANISHTQLKAATGLSFEMGKAAPSDILTAKWSGLNNTDGKIDKKDNALSHFGTLFSAKVSEVSNDNLNLWNIDTGIPMSGYRTIRVQNTIEESFSIEVVRMVAKLQFQFVNYGDEEVNVKSVSIDPVTVTPVALFPDYDIIGINAYTPLEGADYACLTYTPSSPINVTKNSEIKQKLTLYLKESICENANGGLFTIRLNVSHGTGGNYIEQYNLTQNIKEYINRNDWILIPIALTEYDIKVEALFYPPIGGYPAYMSTTDPDGSQVFTFGTEGEMSIVPYVTDKQIGSHLPADRYKMSVASISDPHKIFIKDPVIQATTSTSLPDEIFATLGSNTGTAEVTLKIDIYDNEYYKEGAAKIRTYSRKIFIIRDNNVAP